MAISLGLRHVDSVDVRIYNIDWSPWLKGTPISNSTWSVPSGLTNLFESNTTARTSIKLSGWVTGQSYTIYNTIQTSAGETRRVSFSIECD